MRKNIFLTAAAAALLSVCLPPLAPGDRAPGPGVAYGQDDDPEVTRMAKEHYKIGLDAYKAGKYDVAIKELKKAYLLKRLPAILINIALTYRKTKDYDMASYFYKKFLAEAPADDKQRSSAESGMGETEAEKAAAMAQATPRADAAKPAIEMAKPKPLTPPHPASGPGTSSSGVQQANPPETGARAAQVMGTEWAHTPIDAAPPNQPIDVRVQMPVMKGVKVKVYFRKEGQATFDSLELKRRGNEKMARLPAPVASGKTFQYYLEARDGAGTLINSSGSEASPNIVLIDAGARQQVAGAEAEGPDDEELAKKTKPGFSRDIENESASFDVNSHSDHRSAMDKLHDQMGREQEQSKKPSKVGTIGWIGVGAMGLGVVALAAGGAMFGLAQGQANAVSADSTCTSKIMFKGASQCPHFGPNPDPSMNATLKPPTSADFESAGKTYDLTGKILTPIGGVLAVAGAGLLVYDVLSHRARERAAAEPVIKRGKKKKVRKVIEVEEETFLFAPVVGPKAVGLSGGFRF